MKTPLRAHSDAPLMIREYENVRHLPTPPVKPLTISLWWQALCGRVLHYAAGALLPGSASLLGGRERVITLPFTAKT